MGTSWQIIDTDLIPNNIKDSVDVFGITGDYSGGVWTLWVWKSQVYNVSSIQTFPQYAIVDRYDVIPNWSLTSFYLVWDELFIAIWSSYTDVAAQSWATFVKINLITWAMTMIWWVWLADPDGFYDMKYESWHVYFNFSHYLWWWSYEDRYYDIDVAAWTQSTVQVWRHLTWTTISWITSIILWWQTFEQSTTISWENLRTQDGSMYIAWKWILVS